MNVFPIIEGYRRELQAMTFARLDAAATAELDRGYRAMHHSNAIEGVHPAPETVALFRMLVEESVPPAVSGPFVDRYLQERVLRSVVASVA